MLFGRFERRCDCMGKFALVIVPGKRGPDVVESLFLRTPAERD